MAHDYNNPVLRQRQYDSADKGVTIWNIPLKHAISFLKASFLCNIVK